MPRPGRDGRGLRPYNSGPHGLLLNYNTLLLGLYPGKAANEPVTLAAEPALAGIDIDNRILTSDAPCGTWYGDLQASIEGGRRLVLSGSLPAACGPRTWSAAPLPPAAYGAALVSTLWSEVGGRLGGTIRDGQTPTDAQELFSDDSPALADVVRDMNKWSSNVIARQLLASLAATHPSLAPETSDMVAEGARIALESLARVGLDTRALQTLLRAVDTEQLVPALRAAPPALRDQLLSAMPQRAAEALRDEVDSRGPVKLDEAATAQKAIAAAARRLAAEGTISLPGKGPAYV